MDWEDLKTFLAVARHGTLSAGARALKVSQTTMGRRLDTLHARIGTTLLRRTPTGFVLTTAGERILAGVERMEAEALDVERMIGGEDARLEGLVRIATVDSFGARIVTPALARLQSSYPAIAVELITGVRSLSLARREADLAIRLAPFEQQEAIVQRVADMAFGLYASPAYLDTRGLPDWSGGAAGHRLIVLQDDLAGLPEALWLQEIAPAAMRALYANSREAQMHACAAGLGLACLPRYLADTHAGIALIEPPSAPPMRGIWLGVHRDLQTTPRIRVVRDAVITEIHARAAALAPAHR